VKTSKLAIHFQMKGIKYKISPVTKTDCSTDRQT
jgi:hypothetical protein